ncbi:hypothetical protein D9M68_547030 [compost metagenome]
MQLEPATLAQALPRQGQFVEILGDAGGVQVFAVVAAAIEVDMLGPAEQVFQAKQQQPSLAGAFLDPLGALAHDLLLGAWHLQSALALFTQIAGLRFAKVFRRIQPQRQRPRRAFATREMLDAARFAQGLAQRLLQRSFILAELAWTRAQ